MTPVWEGYTGEPADPAMTVEQILEKIRSKHKKSKYAKEHVNSPDSPSILMKGKSKYLIPDKQTLRESLRGSIKMKTHKHIKSLAKDEYEMAGVIM